MDNFFEILIYLIIIVSFLSSLFKKKEPEKKPGTTTPHPKTDDKSLEGSIDLAKESKQSESYDILREIENIFKENMGIPVPSPTQSQTSAETKAEEKYEQAFQRNYDKEDIRTLSAEDRAIKSRQDIKKLDEKTIREAEKFEELLMTKSALIKKQHPIVSKLYEPKSLKEYILISEILGKPVAYKR